MRSPCGDHVGLPSLSPAVVSLRGDDEAVGSSQTLVRPLFSFIEYEVTAHTAAAASGDRVTAPARSSRQSVSTSMGFFRTSERGSTPGTGLAHVMRARRRSANRLRNYGRKSYNPLRGFRLDIVIPGITLAVMPFITAS